MWRKGFCIIGLILLILLLFKSQVIGGTGHRVYAACYLPWGKPPLARVQVEPEVLDPFEIRDSLFSGGTPAALRAGTTMVFNQGGASLRVFQEAGGFVYDSLASFGPWEHWQGGNMHAGQLMQDFVHRTGGFPLGLEFQNRLVHRQGVFITGYTFLYRQIIKGYPVLGYGGLRVVLGDGFLVHMTRSLYRHSESVEEPRPVLSVREAIKTVVDNTSIWAQSSRVVYGVRLGYFAPWPEVPITCLEPVWEIRFEHHTLFVNALTGELMFGDGSRLAPGKTSCRIFPSMC